MDEFAPSPPLPPIEAVELTPTVPAPPPPPPVGLVPFVLPPEVVPPLKPCPDVQAQFPP